ncbi:MAG: helix-turn-helix domain-containing protein [Gammaproteobacteria bacterium]|nr:helix-turn-helix domain-containing protein [Gammaproteobacteria bacterium]
MQIPQNEYSFLKSYAPDVENETTGFVSLETNDPSLFELALQPWELLARPKSAAPFRHSISMLRGENFLLYREKFSRSVSVIGLSPPGMLGIGVPLSSGVEAKYWGHVHGLESCPIILPGPLNVAWEHDHQQIIALVEINSLQASMSNREFEQLVVLAKVRRAGISPKVRNAFAMFMEGTLKLCAAQLKLSANSGFQRHTYKRLVFFLSSIARATLSENVSRQSSFRSRGFQRAIDFLRESEPINLTMAELCRVAEVSERTLQYAFKDVFDISPQEFITRRRLHSVRHALLTCDRRSAFVGQIAMDHGFFELGHFAGKYRRLFGELPSETLSKQGQ